MSRVNNLTAGERRRLLLAFGFRVAMLREARGWTQGELAKRMGRTRAHVCNIERGNNSVPLEQVYVLATALNVRVSKLLPKEQDYE